MLAVVIVLMVICFGLFIIATDRVNLHRGSSVQLPAKPQNTFHAEEVITVTRRRTVSGATESLATRSKATKGS